MSGILNSVSHISTCSESVGVVLSSIETRTLFAALHSCICVQYDKTCVSISNTNMNRHMPRLRFEIFLEKALINGSAQMTEDGHAR